MKFATRALYLLVATFAVSCGVKGPPLPPISSEPERAEEKSLGRAPAPVKPIPSASPSQTGGH